MSGVWGRVRGKVAGAAQGGVASTRRGVGLGLALGVPWQGLARLDRARLSPARLGTARLDAARHGMARHASAQRARCTAPHPTRKPAGAPRGAGAAAGHA
ncbi:hypothetical protein BVI1335_320002 [Burkholderia vietnamiensis]|nr:hypothetical protein BVI1335_320002 [Burkholderia vietnamiensis]